MRIEWAVFRDLLLFMALFALLLLKWHGKAENHKTEGHSVFPDDQETVIHFFPSAATTLLDQDSLLQVYDSSGVHLGTLVDSRPYAGKIYGFGGPTPLLIALDTGRRVLGTEITAHNETASYIRFVRRKGLFDSWNGLSISEALEKQVDGVSGATLTSQAIITTFKERMGIMAEITQAKETDYGKWLKTACSLLLLGVTLYAFFRPSRMKGYRVWILGSCAVILGFWQGIFISLASMDAWLSNGVSLGIHFFLFLLFLLAVILPWITGKAFYCTWVCPFGALQELAGKVFRKKFRIPPAMLRFLSGMRPYLLLTMMLLLLLNVVSDLSVFEPFAAFYWRSASSWELSLAGVFLLLSAFVPRCWCRFFCPTGELLDLPRRWSLRRKKSTGK